MKYGVGKKILYLLTEQNVKPARFIEVYRKNSGDIKRTLDYFYKYRMMKLAGGSAGSRYSRTVDFILKNNIGLLNIGHKSYPDILSLIYCPPPLLFYRGRKIKEANFCVAVVGSRKCSAYGREVAEYIGRNLSRIGITVVSGLACGIDSFAQKAAMEEKGGSIGVLGCGIDIIYPPENKELYRRIPENGSIVTEFPPGTPPLKSNFPVRNRIISGLSRGVIVVEAGNRSGAIITGEMALKQNREVFAVPGNIFNPVSRGCHMLIKSGAKLAADIDDILEEFSEYQNQNLKLCGSGSGKKGRTMNNRVCKLNTNCRKVYKLIGHRPKSIEEIVKSSGLEVKEALGVLVSLQLKQLIKEDSFNRYSRLF